MKKFFSHQLILLLFLMSFTNCSPKSLLSPNNPVTLTLWHVYGEQADSPMNRLIEEFNTTIGEEKGILVTVTNVSSTSKIGTQLLEALAENPGAPQMPDLFSCHTTTAVSLGAEYLVDWNAYFTQEELSHFVPEFIQDGTIDDKFSVFPVSKSTYALFVNGSQFERFSNDTGITYDMLSTWDGFFDVAKSYYEWSGGKTFCAFDYLIRHIELDILAKGEEVCYTEHGWYDLNDIHVQESWMKFAQPLVQGYIGISDLYANTQVMTGETIAGIGSTAAIAYYNDVVTYPDNTSEKMNLQVLPLPKTAHEEQQKEFMPQTGVGLAACNTTPQKAEAASVFIRWFTEGQRNLEFVVETGYMPVNLNAFSAIEDYTFSNENYKNLYTAIHTMKDTYTPIVRPDFDGFYDKTNLLYQTLRDNQKQFCERFHNGEDLSTLLEETWTIFSSISPQ